MRLNFKNIRIYNLATMFYNVINICSAVIAFQITLEEKYANALSMQNASGFYQSRKIASIKYMICTVSVSLSHKLNKIILYRSYNKVYKILEILFKIIERQYQNLALHQSNAIIINKYFTYFDYIFHALLLM